MRMLAIIFVLSLSLVGSVQASGYSVGYTYTDAYGSWTLNADGYWYDQAGYPYTLHEYSKRVWNARYCRWESVVVYNYTRYYPPKPVINIKAPDFYERLADNLAADKESDKRSQLLQLFYGQGYGGYGYNQRQRIELYGGQYNYREEKQIDYTGLLSVALTQQGLNTETYIKNAPVVQQMTNQTIDRLVDSAGQAALIRELRQTLIETQRANKPAAVIQNETNLPQPPARLQLEQPVQIDYPSRIKIITERFLPSVPAEKRMPKGGAQLTEEEMRAFAAGDFTAIDSKHKCSACHLKNEVKFLLR